MPVTKGGLKSFTGVAVDMQVGGAGNEWQNVACSAIGPVTEDQGALTPIWCPDPGSPSGRKLYDKTRAVPADITFDHTVHYNIGQWLEELECNFNIQVRHFCDGVREDVTNYEQIKRFCDVDMVSRAFTDMAMLDTSDNLIDVTGSMDAGGTEYINKMRAIRLLGNLADLDVALNDVFFCDSPSCGSGCGKAGVRSDGCQKWYAVGDDRGPGYAYGANPILLMYDGTKLGADNKRDVREITGLLGNAIFGFCVGDRVFAFDASGNFAYINNPWDATETWTVISNQFEAGAPPTAAFVAGRHIFLSAQGGYIYESTDGGLTYSSLVAGDITAEDLNAISGYGDEYVVAVGNNGAVILTSDGGDTWEDISTGAAITLNTVAIPRPVQIYTGGTDGLVYWTKDGGDAWFSTDPGLGSGSVVKLSFCGTCDDGNSAFLLFQLATGAMRLVRSHDGGATWSELVTLPTSTPQLNDLECCSPNGFIAVGELFTGTTPYAAVIQGVRAI